MRRSGRRRRRSSSRATGSTATSRRTSRASGSRSTRWSAARRAGTCRSRSRTRWEGSRENKQARLEAAPLPRRQAGARRLGEELGLPALAQRRQRSGRPGELRQGGAVRAALAVHQGLPARDRLRGQGARGDVERRPERRHDARRHRPRDAGRDQEKQVTHTVTPVPRVLRARGTGQPAPVGRRDGGRRG